MVFGFDLKDLFGGLQRFVTRRIAYFSKDQSVDGGVGEVEFNGHCLSIGWGMGDGQFISTFFCS